MEVGLYGLVNGKRLKYKMKLSLFLLSFFVIQYNMINYI